MRITLKHGTKTYNNLDVADAARHGIPQDIIDVAVAKAEAAGRRELLRTDIRVQAGDTLSMLGTTADAAALSTLGVAALTVAVGASDTFADFKAAFLGALGQLAGEQDMVAISASFLAKIESGDVVIPAMAKGMEAVIADIEARSTGVSNAILAAGQG